MAPTKALTSEWSSQGANLQNSRYVSTANTNIRDTTLDLSIGPTKLFDIGSSVYATPAGITIIIIVNNYSFSIWRLFDIS